MTSSTCDPSRYDPAKAWAKKNENKNTRVLHNAADSIFNVSGQLPGIEVGDVSGVPIKPMLVAPDAPPYDFRPKAGSQLEQMQAGAYSSSTAAVWIPGVRTAPSSGSNSAAGSDSAGGDAGGSDDDGVPHQHGAAVEYWAAFRAKVWGGLSSVE